MIIRKKWNRRQFLRSAGVGAAASALIPILPRLAAQTGAAPKRLLLISTGNGSILPFLRPTRGGADLAHNDALAGATSQILQPLIDRYADKMLLVDGLDISSWVTPSDTGSHGAITSLWTGSRESSPSVDQVIADHIGGSTAVHSLQTSTFGEDETFSSFSTSAGHQGLPSSNARSATFDRLFGGFTPDTMPPAVDYGPERSRRSFDVLRGEISRLRAELPSDDRHRLDEHLCRFDALQARITTAPPAGMGCTVGSPPSPGPLDLVPADAALIAQAFACDRTRVISHQLTLENGIFNRIERITQHVPTFDSSFGNDHNTSHATERSPDATRAFATMKEFETNAVVQFLDALAATPDGDGNLLDNTIVVWGTGMSHGGPHDSRMTPCMIFHGDNGPFRTGRLIRKAGTNLLSLEQWCNKNVFRQSVGNGWAHNRLLTALLEAFDVPVDLDTFGDPRFGGGPLEELY